MKHIKYLLVLLIGLVFFFPCNKKTVEVITEELNKKPKISFSFDDGSTNDMNGMTYEEWNRKILNSLKKHNTKAVFFVFGKELDSEKGRNILAAWDNDGHRIASHTYSHPNLNDATIDIEKYTAEIIKGDSLVKDYKNYYRCFRYPYLAEGNTYEKRDKVRGFLSKHDFKFGHVTIDASDWYMNGRLMKKIKSEPDADISAYKDYYINHSFERALYFDSLGVKLTNRRIKHVMLMHHNLTSALFLDDLIQKFKDEGWEIINTDDAYSDHIYTLLSNTMPASGTLLPRLAQSKNLFEEYLKDASGDGSREEKQMDALGL